MKKLDKFSDKLIWLLISGYILLFCRLCFLKYHSFGYYDWDFASDVITLWNSVHGKMFYYPFLEEIIFGAHLYLIIVFIIPIYALFQHPLTLLFLQTIFLGLSAYPLYLLAKLKLNKTFALIISLSYLLYPPLGHINLFETHFEIYNIFFLFFALYFFEKENFKKFMTFIFLAIICKENVSLVIFMFGIYALLRKKGKKWIIIPSLLGLSWFLLAVKVIIPYFAKDANLYHDGFMFNVYYQHLGSNISEMLKTLLQHPAAAFKFAFSPHKLSYLYKVFSPTAFIGFLSPGVLLISLPIFMQNLLSSAPTHTKIYFHYTALLIPFIFASVVFSFKKLLLCGRIYPHRYKILFGLLLISIASSVYSKAPQVHFAKYIKIYQTSDLVRAKNRLIKLIPKKASVIAGFQFLPKLANRQNLYSIHFVTTGRKMYTRTKYEPPQNLEYALIDFNEPLMIKCFFPPQAPANMCRFLECGNWRVLSAADDIVLFKKEHRPGPKLREIVKNIETKNPLNVKIGDRVIFLGYDLKQKNEENNTLHFIFYWQYTENFHKPLGLFMEFFNKEADIKFAKTYSFNYRLYSLGNTVLNQIVKEHRYVLIPSNVPSGIYNVKIGLYNLENRNILPLWEKDKKDNFGRIDLGSISIDGN